MVRLFLDNDAAKLTDALITSHCHFNYSNPVLFGSLWETINVPQLVHYTAARRLPGLGIVHMQFSKLNSARSLP